MLTRILTFCGISWSDQIGFSHFEGILHKLPVVRLFYGVIECVDIDAEEFTCRDFGLFETGNFH